MNSVAGLSTEEKRTLLARMLGERAAKPRSHPLSFAQQRLWFLDQIEPQSTAYHVWSALRVTGAFSARLLGAALAEIVRRHKTLRTTFDRVDGQPVQMVAPTAEPALTVLDLTGLPPAMREAEVRRASQSAGHTPFDLARGPLLRTWLLRLAPSEAIVLVVMHHIISDGWSLGVLVKELGALYEAFAAGHPSPLPPLPLQYVDFVAWQRSRLTGEALETLTAWWKKSLAGAPMVLELPTDRPRPPVQRYRGAGLHIAWPAELRAALAGLARRQGATLFMVLLAGFQALLQRHTGQDDLCVGTPVAGRNRQELEPLIGFFSNILVLRGDLTGDPPFRELVARARETALGAVAHQDIPFEKLVEVLQPPRDTSRTPLFQVSFALQNVPDPTIELPDLTLVPDRNERESAKFDLTVELAEDGDILRGVAEYDRDLFDGITVERLVDRFARLLAGAAVDPECRLGGLPLLAESEQSELLAAWEAPAPAPSLILPELFEQQAKRTPAGEAVSAGGTHLSYRDLDERADRLAHHLRELGIGPEARVAVALERTADLPVALLAVLKAGGAYVPLDPGYPRERLKLILEDARAAALITTEPLLAGPLAGLASLPEQVVLLDSPGDVILTRGTSGRIWAGGAFLPPDPSARNSPQDDVRIDPDHPAYVLFTSGSTGRPKGVVVPHRALANFLLSMRHKPGFQPGDRLLAVTSLSFDIAALEIFLPLITGGCVEIAGRAEAADGAWLAARLARSPTVTALQATPATWRMLVEAGWQGDGQIQALCGGEALPRPLASALAARAGEVWNLYGPTETTVWSSVRRVEAGDEDAAGPVPLGRPIAATRLRVLDRGLRQAPAGTPGELCIGGDGVARGYLGRPDLTAERFVPDPFAGPGERLYRTGDLVRIFRGDLEYLGRLDHQVKIRGFRIELGDIEAALLRHPAVSQAVVVAAPGPRQEADRRLVAYVVASGGRETLREEIREALRQSLPEPLIPSAWVFLPAFPLTPNGKVDRKALPPPEPPAPIVWVAPRSSLERTVAELWQEILGAERVGLHDNFFDLGGHSLLMAQVQARLQERLSREVSMVDLLSHATVERLARFLDGGQPAAENAAAARVERRALREEGGQERLRRLRGNS
jgi:amino acid adenylation domain-containing protein